MLVLDRVQGAISLIMKVDERIRFPLELAIPHPIRLIKEAEQQTPAPQCRTCGSRDHLEKHHVAGRANYADTIPLCETCHDELSSIYQPKWIRHNCSSLECYFLGWSDIFHLMWVKTKHPYFHELSKSFALNAGYAQ